MNMEMARKIITEVFSYEDKEKLILKFENLNHAQSIRVMLYRARKEISASVPEVAEQVSIQLFRNECALHVHKDISGAAWMKNAIRVSHNGEQREINISGLLRKEDVQVTADLDTICLDPRVLRQMAEDGK